MRRTAGRPAEPTLDDPEPVEVGRGRLTVADVVAVARENAPVRLADGARVRLETARAVVDRLAAGDRPVYGLTTGLGAAVDTRLASGDIATFQNRAVLARAVDVGPPLPVDAVRAALLARLVGLAAGASGISPALADAVAAMLNSGVHPVVRATGSLGEADLAQAAALFLPLAGAGEVEFAGAVLPGAEALRRAGIAPPALGPKDGLALINTNGVSAGRAALAIADLGRAARALTVAAALSVEAFRANLSVLDPRLARLRPAPGQADAAARLRALLAGSDLGEPGAARRVQDPLSFRCVAPVHGALLWRLGEATGIVEDELNGAGDSPAVLPDTGEILSTVNFDTTALALTLEALGAAAAAAGALSAARVTRLMNGDLTGLPRFLARTGGSRAGFAPVGKTVAALDAEIRHLALPVGPVALPVADGVEDYAPSTGRVVAKTGEIADRLALVAALEMLVAAEAIDQRGPVRLGRGTGRAHAVIRERAAPLLDDRPTGADIRRLGEAVVAGLFEPDADADGEAGR